MSTPTNHWKLGLFVVVGVAVALGGAVYLGAASLRKQHVSYHTYFDESVAGLEVGSPIQFRGVKVGQVSEIGVAPDRRHVAVTMALFTKNLHGLGLGEGSGTRTRIVIPPDLRVQLVGQGITGLKSIQIDFFDVERNPAPALPFAPPETYIPAAKSTMEKLEDAVVGAFDRFPAVADALLGVAAHANRILADFDRAKLPDHAQTTLAELNATLGSLRGAIRDARVGALSKQTEAAIGNLDRTVQRLDAVLARLDGDDGLIASATRTTDAVGDAAAGAPEIGEEMIYTLREIQDAADSFRRLTDAIEREPDMLLRGRKE